MTPLFLFTYFLFFFENISTRNTNSCHTYPRY
nr:MAG TPA: hypothetical protein [Bacteriophage sp.]